MSPLAADIQIIPARASHIRSIARRMRKADRDEVFASSRKTPAQALAYSLRKSSLAYTGMVDGRPEVMFGVGDINILAEIGAPWLLGTDAVEANSVAFLRRSVRWREQLLARYRVLRNLVDDRNTVSKRWLGWLGFKLFDPIEVGGYSFRLFEMRR